MTDETLAFNEGQGSFASFRIFVLPRVCKNTFFGGIRRYIFFLYEITGKRTNEFVALGFGISF